jgi:hypothetical protein
MAQKLHVTYSFLDSEVGAASEIAINVIAIHRTFRCKARHMTRTVR